MLIFFKIHLQWTTLNFDLDILLVVRILYFIHCIISFISSSIACHCLWRRFVASVNYYYSLMFEATDTNKAKWRINIWNSSKHNIQVTIIWQLMPESCWLSRLLWGSWFSLMFRVSSETFSFVLEWMISCSESNSLW